MRYRRASIPGASYFFTLVTHQRMALFASSNHASCWHAAVAKVQVKRPFVVEAEVLMPDHVHMIWTLPEGDADYSTRIRLVKTAFSKAAQVQDLGTVKNSSRANKGEREVWQRRYWEHAIRSQADFQAHVDYIHINPVKHGLTERPGGWPHTTFHAWLERGSYDPVWGSGDMPELPVWAGHE